jgi:Zn-dependent protease with chaperone function
MNKITIITVAILMTLGGLLAVSAPVLAGTTGGLINTDDLGLNYGAATGLGSTDVRTTIAMIIKVAMGLLGIVAVVIILIGGFKWMTAGGNEEQVGEAKKWIFSGVIGLAIILSAYALASFIINQLVTATTSTV